MSVFSGRAVIIVAGLALACSLSGFSCGSDAPPPNRPGPGMVSADPARAQAALPAAAPDAVRNQAYTRPPLSSGGLQQPPPPAADTDKAPTAPEKKERDYSAELSALLSSTVSCLTGHKADARAAITINVSAQVMPSGSISRADAQGPGLTPVELSCIQKQVSSLHLNGPIEGAPRSVSGHLTLQAQATKEAPQPKAAVERDDDEENPHDTVVKEVANDPPEAQQHDEPVREAPEPAEPQDQAPHDTHADEQP